MNLTFDVEGFAVPVNQQLLDVLTSIANNNEQFTKCANPTALTFNFRDKSYSAEDGGFHPVEIRIEQANGKWRFIYITDFSFVGFPYPELAKEVDFDFEENLMFSLYQPPQQLGSPNVIGFYKIWLTNFLSYLDMEVFDEITLSID